MSMSVFSKIGKFHSGDVLLFRSVNGEDPAIAKCFVDGRGQASEMKFYVVVEWLAPQGQLWAPSANVAAVPLENVLRAVAYLPCRGGWWLCNLK